MSAEYDDVLTNQPVVIDNVCVAFFQSLNVTAYDHCTIPRVQGQSRRALQDKIIRNVSFHHCGLLYCHSQNHFL
jgi:hypothetical protein